MPERQVVAVRNPNDGEPLDVAMQDSATASNQAAILKQLRALNSFMPADNYDQVILEYDTNDDNTKIIFRAKGKTIAEIEMTYTNHRLTSVFRQAQ